MLLSPMTNCPDEPRHLIHLRGGHRGSWGDCVLLLGPRGKGGECFPVGAGLLGRAGPRG